MASTRVQKKYLPPYVTTLDGTYPVLSPGSTQILATLLAEVVLDAASDPPGLAFERVKELQHPHPTLQDVDVVHETQFFASLVAALGVFELFDPIFKNYL